MLRRRKTTSESEAFPGVPTVRHTYHGLELELTMADETSVGWYDVDWPDVPEIRFLEAHRLQPGANVFDLGAHQCVYAMLLASRVTPGGQVLAVEASQHNVAVSEANLRLNRVDNVVVLHAAVDRDLGEVSFGRGANGQIGEFEDSESVPAIPIDVLANKYGVPDIIFLDIEGFELRALEGATETLGHRPVVFIEVHVGEGLEEAGGSADALVEVFRSRGYDLYLSDESVRQPQPWDDERYAAMKGERFFLSCVPQG